nr:reverse transcriptase domain-containing protein [Tanacetum cinerariifolium]
EKEPPRSIFTWDDLVSKFINQFFPPSKTTNLRNEITNFQQRFNESFSEAWDRFKDLLKACPHHGFSELHQLDTFYNALNSKDQDSLNFAAGGNFLDKMPRECLAIIESKYKVCYSRNKLVVFKVSTNTSSSGISPDVAELKDMVKTLLLDKKSQNQAPATVKAVEESCVTCGGAHSYRNCPATDGNVYRDNIQEFVSQAFTVYYNQGNTSYLSAPRPNQRPSISCPSRLQDLKLRDKANDQREKFFQIFKDLNFNISFADALILMPKFGPSIKSLLTNKDKLCELSRTPLNKHCSVVLLKKLPEKLGDPGKFLIPCDFPGKAKYLALADLGASINLMLLSVWNKLSFPDLTPTCMTLELADRSISHPIRVAEDVYELKIYEAKSDKSSIDEPLEVELKDLPRYLEYAFLEGDDKLPVIIAKELSVEEKTALITVLKSHKRAIAWKLSDIKGIDPEFCTHKILMEEDFEPTVQHQRRVNPKIHDVIKQEVLKLLDAELIYLISDSRWRCMMAIFHDLIEKTMEVFMDDFSVFGNSFQSYLSHLERMLKRCEDTNLCLNWEKSHFMVKEGGNHASWSNKLDDALWVFRTAYKTPIGCTPYKLVYGKAFHLPIELEHKAYWP